MIDLLIEGGHSWEAIQTYTMPMVATFITLLSKRRKRAMAELALTVRSAYHAEQKSFKDFLKSLED